MGERVHLTSVPTPLSSSEARRLTDRAKDRAAELWQLLLDLYERGAHTALGYHSWADYCKAEFDTGKTRAHQLLDAGRVVRAIEGQSTMVDSPPERVARELAPLRRVQGDETVAKVWRDIVAEHGPQPTAAQVRDKVKERMTPPPKRKATLRREQERFGNVLHSMALSGEYIAATIATEGLLDVDAETLATWTEQTRTIDAASARLRRRFTRK